jgi:hypothetical protein
MPEIIIRLDKDEGNFGDLVAGKKVFTLDKPLYLTALAGGMSSGKASVALGFEIQRTNFVVAETSLRLFLLAARALVAKFPNEAADVEVFGAPNPDQQSAVIAIRPADNEMLYAIERLQLDGSPESEPVIDFLQALLQRRGR